MVTLVAPETVRSHVVAAWPETLGVEPDQQASRSRADAVVIGPGLGNDPRRLGEAETALEQCLDDGSPLCSTPPGCSSSAISFTTAANWATTC